MTELPFFFHAPTPRYFRDNGLFKNEKNLAFVTWCFERCSPQPRIVFHDNKKINLQPYQFIFGRMICCEETGLTEDEVRTQQKRWLNAGFLKKAPNKTPNRFTIYEWSMSHFLKDDPQQKTRSTPNKPPTNPHNQDKKNIRNKENHPQTPSFSENDDDDDFFYSTSSKTPRQAKIEVYQGVKMTPKHLERCIAIKGSIEEVHRAIHYIQNHPGRESVIKNWPNAMETWTIPNDTKTYMKKNMEIAKRLDRQFSNSIGWRCRIYKDRKKDQEGLLFECTSSAGNLPTVFIAIQDPDFERKVAETLREKRMQKSRN